MHHRHDKKKQPVTSITEIQDIYQTGLTAIKDYSVPVTYQIGLTNYPNPFNSITNISYHIPDANMVILRVYDILGGEVIALVHDEKTSGYYSVSWDDKDHLS